MRRMVAHHHRLKIKEAILRYPNPIVTTYHTHSSRRWRRARSSVCKTIIIWWRPSWQMTVRTSRRKCSWSAIRRRKFCWMIWSYSELRWMWGRISNPQISTSMQSCTSMTLPSRVASKTSKRARLASRTSDKCSHRAIWLSRRRGVSWSTVRSRSIKIVTRLWRCRLTQLWLITGFRSNWLQRRVHSTCLLASLFSALVKVIYLSSQIWNL